MTEGYTEYGYRGLEEIKKYREEINRMTKDQMISYGLISEDWWKKKTPLSNIKVNENHEKIMVS